MPHGLTSEFHQCHLLYCHSRAESGGIERWVPGIPPPSSGFPAAAEWHMVLGCAVVLDGGFFHHLFLRGVHTMARQHIPVYRRHVFD